MFLEAGTLPYVDGRSDNDVLGGKGPRMNEFDTKRDFESLSLERLMDMRDACAQVMECFRILNASGDNIVGELIKGEDTFYEWNHYPDGDVYDSESHSQFYYHAHPPEERPGEHGHFHTFLRPKGMPEGIAPAPIPEYEAPEDPDDNLCHLVAISMDRAGVPIKLFTTNRWVTGEVWYTAADACQMLDQFVIDHAQPSWPVNLWVSGIVRLFDPQIRALINARDIAVQGWQAANPGVNIFEEREYEVAAECEIDVEAQLEAVETELQRRGAV